MLALLKLDMFFFFLVFFFLSSLFFFFSLFSSSRFLSLAVFCSQRAYRSQCHDRVIREKSRVAEECSCRYLCNIESGAEASSIMFGPCVSGLGEILRSLARVREGRRPARSSAQSKCPVMILGLVAPLAIRLLLSDCTLEARTPAFYVTCP